MAKRFLTDIDLQGNQLIKSSLENLAADPITVLETGRIYYNTTTDAIKIYDGTAWVGIGEIVSVEGTTGEVDVSVVDGVATISLPDNISANAATADKWSTARTVTFATGDVTGSFSIDGSANVSDVALTIASNSVELGTDTTGNYVADITAGTGISVANGTTEGANITVTNTGVTSIAGTTNEVTVDASTGSVTVGLPDDVTIAQDLTVTRDATITGNLTVNGTTTTLNTTELLVEDNLITLNSGVTGTPALNAGVEIERGTSDNVSIRWNETSDTWELTRDGTTYEEITTVGTITASDISDFDEAAQDAVGGILVDGTTIDFTYDDATPSITAEVTLATTSYLATTGGLAVDIATVETKLVTDGFTKKAAASVGNATNTSFAITHSLNTRDVQVQVYDNATYDTIECDVVRTDVDTVTVSFSSAPATDAYRVVVIG